MAPENQPAVSVTSNLVEKEPAQYRLTQSTMGSHTAASEEKKQKLTGFFAIGLVVNILLMVLFGLWAVRQWRKTDKGRGVK